MNAINDRIALVVKETGLSKTAFAQKINVSQQHVSRLCANGNPSDRTISDICREFNVNEVWLRTGAGEMFCQKTAQDEIMDYIGRIIKGDENDFQRRLILLLSQIPTDFWPVLEENAKSILMNDAESKGEKQP